MSVAAHDPTFVAVADVAAAHGLRGLVRVRPYHFPAPSLTAGRAVVLEVEGKRRPARIVSAAAHGRGRLLMGLEGVADRAAAEAVVGAHVLVSAADLDPAAPGEFYYHEVLGFTVDRTDGGTVGRISGTFSTGLNDVWIVRDGGREHLVPVIADVVRAIDRDARRVLIAPLPGLLD